MSTETDNLWCDPTPVPGASSTVSATEPGQGAAFADRILNGLPRLLRGIGAVVVIAALATLLFQGWEAGNDLYRYLLLLGVTTALAIGGFGSGQWLREPKGARTLLSLALVAAPINFAILGALLYSAFRWEALSGPLPGIATWQAGDLGLVLPVFGVAPLLLAVVAHLAFMVLARAAASRLTGLFLVGNALLLIPTRAPDLIGPLALAATLVMAWQSLQMARKEAALRTFEGDVARALLFVAPAILIGRGLWLHNVDDGFATSAALAAFLLLRVLTMAVTQTAWLRRGMELLTLAPALLAAGGLATLIAPNGSGNFHALFILGFSGLIWLISIRSPDAAEFRRWSAIIAACGLLGTLFSEGGALPATATLAVGLALLVRGVTLRERFPTLLGAITALSGLGGEIGLIMDAFDFGHWGLLAATGIGAIVASSLLERHLVRIRATLMGWHDELRQW